MHRKSVNPAHEDGCPIDGKSLGEASRQVKKPAENQDLDSLLPEQTWANASCRKRVDIDSFDDCSEEERKIRQELASRHKPSSLMDALGFDSGWTEDGKVNLPKLRELLEAGADPNEPYYSDLGFVHLPLEIAVSQASLEAVDLLLHHGARADLIAEDPSQSGILDSICSSGKWHKEPDLMLAILERLIDAGANPRYMPAEDQSALQWFWREGKQEAVDLMLTKGADVDQLEMTPLLWAVHKGDREEALLLANNADDLCHRDCRDEDALEKAVRIGHLEIAEDLLGLWGAIDDEKADRLLDSALEGDSGSAIQWVAQQGGDAFRDPAKAFERLTRAADWNKAEALDWLLGIQWQPGFTLREINKVSWFVTDERCALVLHKWGATEFHRSTRAALINLVCPGPANFRLASEDEYERAKHPRWGTSNPEESNEHYYSARLMAWRENAPFIGFDLLDRWDQKRENHQPFWNEERFGQSLTILPDGRIIEIGGEHEDSYDPDFRIYNDVFVHEPGKPPRVLLYPGSVFPPTDFHSATLSADSIFIIGCLGYKKFRSHQTVTPVYRLDLASMAITKVETTGEMPGWISRHSAVLLSPDEITVSGGNVVKGEDLVPFEGTYTLNLKSLTWRRELDLDSIPG